LPLPFPFLHRAFEKHDTNSCTRQLPWKDSCEKIILISNAGTLGDLTQRVADLSDPTVLSSYFNLNLVSCMSIMCANMFSALIVHTRRIFTHPHLANLFFFFFFYFAGAWCCRRLRARL
jgi:hypothetical protein